MIEGLHPDAILEIPPEDLDELLLPGKPIIISIGSATVLAEISGNDRTLTIYLAHIDLS
ncbi:MAG: hypothetical protein ABI876_15160 [Bacteroidota bacterium]